MRGGAWFLNRLHLPAVAFSNQRSKPELRCPEGRWFWGPPLRKSLGQAGQAHIQALARNRLEEQPFSSPICAPLVLVLEDS